MREAVSTNPFSKSSDGRSNTLRIDARTLSALMDKLDAVRAVHPGTRRRYSRFRYRQAEVQVTLTHPGGTSSTLVLCARDISAGGLSLLHNSYVHKGTACNVVLHRPGQSDATISGKVVRCEQLAGLIHEVGVAFTTRVSLREFLCPDPLDEFYSIERINPSELKGRLLHVDHTNLGRRLLKAFLNESQLVIEQFSNIAEGLEAAKGGGFDVIVAEYQLPDGTAPDLITELRIRHIEIPVIILFGESSTEPRESVRRIIPSGILKKPFSQDRLHRCLGEVLLLAKPESTDADAPVNEAHNALVRVFLDEVRCQAMELEKALRAERTEECLRICRELRGAAPTLGFTFVAQAAEAAEKAIIASGAAQEAAKQVGDLVNTCRRAAA